MFCLSEKNSKYKKMIMIKQFFAGLWQGMILSITLILSFFFDGISIYEDNNINTI